MRDTRQYRPKPTGWANFNLAGLGKDHFFGEDGRALCGKWANMTRNSLLRDDELSDDAKCAECRRKRATMLRKQTQS